jgi:putative FmdB family regulatory protein
MPIYEYICKSCDRAFARLRPIDAATAPMRCPHCGSDDTDRVHSTFAAGPSSTRTSRPSGPPPCGGGGG